VQYAYNNNHYYYINHFDKSKHIILENGKELFQEINKYVRNNYFGIKIKEKKHVSYSKLGLMGEIDFMEVYPTGSKVIVDIKCSKDISIKYIIQVVIYNFCKHWRKSPTDIYCNYFKILNLLTGIEHTILFKVNKSDMFDMLNIFAETGNLKFSDMTLVYDLETTNKITFHGPFNYKPEANRGRVWMKNNMFHAETYPDITEIAIVDYDTNMTIINQLVKPNTPVHPEVERLTGIWNRMLVDKDDINVLRFTLESKFNNFSTGSKLLAHNGTCFDNKIMICDNLVDQKKITFLDTMSIIPIHMPVHTQLVKKSVGEIYKQLLGGIFNAHRAMSDVIALIKIMKHLDIKF
jgi:DNA polymerase III epsilon subunit-like protein